MPIQAQLLSAGFSAAQANALHGVQIAAAAGSSQATATKITSPIVVFTSGNGDGVLPAANAGDTVIVVNVSGNSLDVFPASGGTINALSQDAAIAMATAKSCTFVAQSATQWRTVPLVPS